MSALPLRYGLIAADRECHQCRSHEALRPKGEN
jgi:hypothetical protein